MSTHAWRTKRFAGQKDRLKPMKVDPLEEVGLPSKGDERLLSLKVQEDYFDKIRDRCSKIHSNAQPGTSIAALENALSNLQLQQELIGSGKASRDTVLMAMRKLREGIIASARADQFALDAYKYIIRTAVSWQSYEAYQPALLHLLHRIHPRNPLSASDLIEFVSYRVLDLACRLAEYGQAYMVRAEWGLENDAVDKVLASLVRNDWRAFWVSREKADAHQASLIALAEPRVQSSAIQSLTRTYFTVDSAFVLACTGKTVEELVQSRVVDWSVEGAKVTVRRVKGK